MLKKKKQEKYFNRHWEGMFSHLYNFCVSQNPEELHKLRVEVKKLEALFMLSEIFSRDKKHKKKFSKHFQPIKKIFKSAGKIRTAHINLELIKKYGSINSDFEQKQNRILLKQTDKFCVNMITFADIINKSHDKFLKLFFDIDSKIILEFYDKQLRNLDKTFKNYKDETKLHECRKKIKRLFYLHSLLNKSLVEKINLNSQYFDELQDKLGRWHDADVAVELLISANFPDSNIIDELKKQRNEHLKIVSSLTENFLKKAIL